MKNELFNRVMARLEAIGYVEGANGRYVASCPLGPAGKEPHVLLICPDEYQCGTCGLVGSVEELAVRLGLYVDGTRKAAGGSADLRATHRDIGL